VTHVCKSYTKKSVASALKTRKFTMLLLLTKKLKCIALGWYPNGVISASRFI